jgi:hypothetical protein
MDFSGQPEAADYVATFLQAALHRSPPRERSREQTQKDDARAASRRSPEGSPTTETDAPAVRRMLERLHAKGKLSAPDLKRLLRVLEETDAS